MIVEQRHQDGQRFIPEGLLLEKINLVLWAQPHRSWRIDRNDLFGMIDVAIWIGEQSKAVDRPERGPREFREQD